MPAWRGEKSHIDQELPKHENAVCGQSGVGRPRRRQQRSCCKKTTKGKINQISGHKLPKTSNLSTFAGLGAFPMDQVKTKVPTTRLWCWGVAYVRARRFQQSVKRCVKAFGSRREDAKIPKDYPSSSNECRRFHAGGFGVLRRASPELRPVTRKRGWGWCPRGRLEECIWSGYSGWQCSRCNHQRDQFGLSHP